MKTLYGVKWFEPLPTFSFTALAKGEKNAESFHAFFGVPVGVPDRVARPGAGP